jgi:hypothetical protein
MPLYVYQVVREDRQPGERFEIMQGIRDDALTEHPETGKPVKRVVVAPFVAGSHSQTAIERKLKDPHQLENMGFTRYEKQGSTYVKTAGKGPDQINRD